MLEVSTQKDSLTPQEILIPDTKASGMNLNNTETRDLLKNNIFSLINTVVVSSIQTMECRMKIRQ